MRQVVNLCCLVYIDISVFDNLVEALDSDGVLHKQTICCRAKIVQTEGSTKTKTKFSAFYVRGTARLVQRKLKTYLSVCYSPEYLYICHIQIVQYMIKFVIDYASGTPIYRQIIDQIRFGIASGQLKLGEQLPTVRALAVELKVNLNTVSKAYKELEIKNILTTQQGSGTFICQTGDILQADERANKLKEICTQFSAVALGYGFTIEEMTEELKKIETLKQP